MSLGACLLQAGTQEVRVTVTGYAFVMMFGLSLTISYGAQVGVVPNEDCVILKRTVEVLQWVEREKKSNQGESSYTYAKEWCETDVDSSRCQPSLAPCSLYPVHRTLYIVHWL